MKHEDVHARIDEWVSRSLDGELSAEEQERYLEHLDECPESAERAREMEQAIGELRRAELPALGAADVQAIVDAAMPVAAPAPLRPVHPLRERVALVMSHAAVLLVGIGLSRGALGADSSVPTERIVEVEVPVEIEVPVERLVRVEVPVEVPVERIVERVVEVPREVEVIRERIVEVPVAVAVPHPLQARWDTALEVAQGLSRSLAMGATAASEALDRRASRIAAAEVRAAGPSTVPAALANSERRERAGLVVRRTGGRVSLVTVGDRSEVVPALIDALDSGDSAVELAALDQLESMRDSIGGPARASLASLELGERPVDEAGGIRGLWRNSRERREAAVDGDQASRWRDWWESRSN